MTRWKLVPCEPTDEMVVAGDDAIESYDGSIPGDLSGVVSVYSAMLAASPSPGEDVVERVAFALFCHEHGVPKDDEQDTGIAQKWWAAENSKGVSRRFIYRARVRAVLAALEG